MAAKLTGEDAGLQVYIALKRLKALMEAGEIPTTEGQSVGEPQASAKGKNESRRLDGKKENGRPDFGAYF